MNIKKILCFSLAFGSILSLTACSNIKDSITNSSVEQNKINKEDNEIDKKIKESIINQLKIQLNSYKGQPFERDQHGRIKIPIENDTEYTITMTSFYINIEDEKGKSIDAGLFIENCIILEPGQKCYASLMVDSDFTGVKDIIEIKDDLLNDDILGIESKEYTVIDADVSDIKFNQNDKGRFGTISCTLKNNTENSYIKGLLYVEYKDKDGYLYNNVSSLDIPELISKKSYPIEMIVRKSIDDKNNITFKLYFKH